jgi:membrane-bound lytic murein transglycosylase D
MDKTMIKMSTYALVTTSLVAIFSGSGCSNNLKKPTVNTPKFQKASLDTRTSGIKTQTHKASYSKKPQPTQAKPNKHGDTWARVFQGFKLPNHTNKAQVQRFVNQYGRNPRQLSALSERASTYLHMIVHEVDRRNLPTELALLPFVESAFKPDVFSHAGAAGLWQFIPETGKRYGLRQAKGYDARMDPFAATGAALDYLEKLNADFNGDWLLALAAYNCGEGRVQREINRNRSKGLPTDFWNLSLPKETREYVPRLLAFKELTRNAKRYGIALADTPNEAKLAQLRVDKPVNLRQVALQAGLDADHLISLNPYFRTGITTPHYSNRIVLPREHAQRLTQVIATLPPASPRAAGNAHQYNTLATTRTGKKASKSTQYTRVKTNLRSAQLHKQKVNA